MTPIEKNEEAAEPLPVWWLSFVKPNAPNDGHGTFLGCIITEAVGFEEAVLVATLLGINPGGECAVVWLPPGSIAKEYQDKLLNEEEARAVPAPEDTYLSR